MVENLITIQPVSLSKQACPSEGDLGSTGLREVKGSQEELLNASHTKPFPKWKCNLDHSFSSRSDGTERADVPTECVWTVLHTYKML